jgi:hypothetical protein
MAAMWENPLTEVMKSKYNFRLSSRTMALLADGLRGKRSGRRGPRKQTAEELQANTPIHGAAAEVATIKPILSNAYENEKGIAEHAITIAAKRAKVSRKTLANYLRSRRRPRP